MNDLTPADITADAKRFNQTVGAILRAEASYAGKSVAQLSRETGIEYVTLGRYLRGQRDIPLPVLYRCASRLDTSVEAIMRDAMQRLRQTATTAPVDDTR